MQQVPRQAMVNEVSRPQLQRSRRVSLRGLSLDRKDQRMQRRRRWTGRRRKIEA